MSSSDTLNVPCPKCYKHTKFQSKAGRCRMEEYNLKTAPLAILADVFEDSEHGCLVCEHCGEELRLLIQVKTEVVVATNDAPPAWMNAICVNID